MTKNEAAQAVGEPWHKFNKHLLDYRSKAEGKSLRYFIPFEQLTPQAQTNLSSRVEELPSDDAADIVEGILGDVSGAEFAVTSEERLREARIANTEARTKMLIEKLERRKTELFNEWSRAFFEAFCEAFTKFKNELIVLQLTEEQLSNLQEKLSLALQSLKDKLDFLEQDYGKDDKDEDDLLR